MGTIEKAGAVLGLGSQTSLILFSPTALSIVPADREPKTGWGRLRQFTNELKI